MQNRDWTRIDAANREYLDAYVKNTETLEVSEPGGDR